MCTLRDKGEKAKSSAKTCVMYIALSLLLLFNFCPEETHLNLDISSSLWAIIFVNCLDYLLNITVCNNIHIIKCCTVFDEGEKAQSSAKTCELSAYVCAFSMHKFCWENPSKSSIKWRRKKIEIVSTWVNLYFVQNYYCYCFTFNHEITKVIFIQLLYSLLSASVVPQLSWFVWNWTLQQLTDMNLNELRKKILSCFPRHLLVMSLANFDRIAINLTAIYLQLASFSLLHVLIRIDVNVF